MTIKTIKIQDKEYQVNCYEENGKTVVELPEELKRLDSYGTALKPAYEPIVLCRKPLAKGGYVNSVLEYGTSGLNIDGGRIGTTDNYNFKATGLAANKFFTDGDTPEIIKQSNSLGRFPANFGLICTCEKEPCECVGNELDRQSGISKSVKNNLSDNRLNNGNSIFLDGVHNPENSYSDKGGASRFFYTAKASSKERELGLDELELQETQVTGWSGEGMPLRQNGTERKMPVRYNNHPTVKPIKLIEYLATLLLPPIDNSSILIPFSGVGSEMIGANLAGWQNITGIEIDEHYVEIANKRLEYWTQFDNYDDAMKHKQETAYIKQLNLL